MFMRFEIPQFINVEDKLFGPFTFRQSLYLVGGGGLAYIFYKTLPNFIAILLGVPVIAFSLALVFYKPNGRPFIKMVEASILYAFSHKFYLWRRSEKIEEQRVSRVEQVHQKFPEKGEIPEDKRRRISDLAWSLDILDFEENQKIFEDEFQGKDFS